MSGYDAAKRTGEADNALLVPGSCCSAAAVRRSGGWMPTQVQLLRLTCGLPGTGFEDGAQRHTQER